MQKTVARKVRAASPKGKSSGGKDARQAKRKPTHEPPALNAAVKAQKAAAKTGPSGPKWGGMLCRGTWSNSEGSSCFINAALSFLSLLPWPPTLPVECPDLLREVHVAILAMRAGRDTGTLSAHRARVRTALVAAFPEEGFHVGQHDAGEVVLLVLRRRRSNATFARRGRSFPRSNACLASAKWRFP